MIRSAIGSSPPQASSADRPVPRARLRARAAGRGTPGAYREPRRRHQGQERAFAGGSTCTCPRGQVSLVELELVLVAQLEVGGLAVGGDGGLEPGATQGPGRDLAAAVADVLRDLH